MQRAFEQHTDRDDSNNAATAAAAATATVAAAAAATSASASASAAAALVDRDRGACALCALSKVKCENERPCARCVRIGKADECRDRDRRRRVSQRHSRPPQPQPQSHWYWHSQAHSQGEPQSQPAPVAQPGPSPSYAAVQFADAHAHADAHGQQGAAPHWGSSSCSSDRADWPAAYRPLTSGGSGSGESRRDSLADAFDDAHRVDPVSGSGSRMGAAWDASSNFLDQPWEPISAAAGSAATAAPFNSLPVQPHHAALASPAALHSPHSNPWAPPPDFVEQHQHQQLIPHQPQQSQPHFSCGAQSALLAAAAASTGFSVGPSSSMALVPAAAAAGAFSAAAPCPSTAASSSSPSSASLSASSAWRSSRLFEPVRALRLQHPHASGTLTPELLELFLAVLSECVPQEELVAIAQTVPVRLFVSVDAEYAFEAQRIESAVRRAFTPQRQAQAQQQRQHSSARGLVGLEQRTSAAMEAAMSEALAESMRRLSLPQSAAPPSQSPLARASNASTPLHPFLLQPLALYFDLENTPGWPRLSPDGRTLLPSLRRRARYPEDDSDVPTLVWEIGGPEDCTAFSTHSCTKDSDVHCQCCCSANNKRHQADEEQQQQPQREGRRSSGGISTSHRRSRSAPSRRERQLEKQLRSERRSSRMRRRLRRKVRKTKSRMLQRFLGALKANEPEGQGQDQAATSSAAVTHRHFEAIAQALISDNTSSSDASGADASSGSSDDSASLSDSSERSHGERRSSSHRRSRCSRSRSRSRRRDRESPMRAARSSSSSSPHRCGSQSAAAACACGVTYPHRCVSGPVRQLHVMDCPLAAAKSTSLHASSTAAAAIASSPLPPPLPSVNDSGAAAAHPSDASAASSPSVSDADAAANADPPRVPPSRASGEGAPRDGGAGGAGSASSSGSSSSGCRCPFVLDRPSLLRVNSAWERLFGRSECEFLSLVCVEGWKCAFDRLLTLAGEHWIPHLIMASLTDPHLPGSRRIGVVDKHGQVTNTLTFAYFVQNKQGRVSKLVHTWRKIE